MFYLARNPDPTANGIVTIETQPDAQEQRLSWFGSWRWRDNDSVYYVPFNPQSEVHQLMYYHVPTGEQRFLTDPQTQPFTIMNGEWSVLG